MTNEPVTRLTNQSGFSSTATQSAHDLYARWLLELWHGDQSGIDELVAEECVGHWPDGDVCGKDGLRAVIEQTR